MSALTRLGPGGYPVAAGGPVTYTKTVNVSTASAVSVVKQASKALSWTTASAVVTAATRAQLVAIAISTVSALTTIKQVGKTLSWLTASAPLVTKSATKTLTISTSSTPAVIKQVGKVLAWTTTSAASVGATFAKVGKALITLVGRAASMLLSGQVSQLALASRVAQLELDAMSTWQNDKFHLGETWIISGIARDRNGGLLDLTGATVALRIGSESPNSLTLDLATPADGSINSPATAGEYTFLITPAQQASMTLTSYEYEVRVTLAGGSKSVQNKGIIEIKPSLFVNFP